MPSGTEEEGSMLVNKVYYPVSKTQCYLCFTIYGIPAPKPEESKPWVYSAKCAGVLGLITTNDNCKITVRIEIGQK